VKSTSFLYTHGDLQITLKESIQNSNGMIVHHKVPFEALGDDTTEKERNDETKLILRPYQEEAIETLLEPSSEVTSDESDYDESDHESEINYENRKIVKLFTGGGKTVIAANLFKRTNYKLIICIAPLLTSVENLEERIKPFLKNYESLTVDSDTHGCTDEDEIKKFITNTKCQNKIIFSTYISTENILINVLKDVDKSEAFLLVDEVHNMVKVNNTELCEFSNTFKNALFLSATIPEELYERVNAELVFDYSIGKAIQDDFCVDYTVYLPLIDKETNSIKIDIPTDLSELPRDLTNKAIFLANGMLLKGNRKCIAYLSDINDSVEFARVLEEVFLKFHGIHMWTGVIHANVSTKDRKSILKTFQTDALFQFHVLCSVRILDEAIDIPKCDSQFIANIGDNPIRTVQRLGRGLRLDENNLSKHNSMFIWCEDSNNALTALSLLKHSDPEFHKKIRVIQTQYDTAGSSEIQQRVKEVSKEVQRIVATKCLSMDEIWEFRCENYAAFVTENKRRPTSREKFKDWPIGWWQGNRRANYKNRRETNKDIPLNERELQLESLPLWVWVADKFYEQCENYAAFVNKNERRPTSQEKFECWQIGKWQSKQREDYMIRRRRKKDVPLNEKELHLIRLPLWVWDTYEFDKQCKKYAAFVNKNKRRPTSQEKFKDWPIGTWQGTQRSNFTNRRKTKIDIPLNEKELQLERLPLWVWVADKFDEHCENYAAFVNKNKRRPTQKEQFKDWSIGIWQCGQRCNFTNRRETKKDIPLNEKELQLESLPLWVWVLDEFDEQCKNYAAFANTNKRRPTSQEKFEGWTIGTWQSNYRQKYKKRRETKKYVPLNEKEMQLESLPLWVWKEL
jgi:superfamily II DNA or RNA helicase